jgi:hypothetical protein
MLRMALAAATLVVSASAFAQEIDEMRGIKYGVGCVGPVSTYAERFGTCDIEGKRSRNLVPEWEDI